jgi:hypothetical protein
MTEFTSNITYIGVAYEPTSQESLENDIRALITDEDVVVRSVTVGEDAELPPVTVAVTVTNYESPGARGVEVGQSLETLMRVDEVA